MTDTRLHEGHARVEVDELEVVFRRPSASTWRRDWRLRLEGRLSMAEALLLAVAWPVLFGIGLAVEPPPAHPEAAPPVVVALAANLVLLAMAVTAAGLLVRRRWSMLASLGASGTLLALTLACPLSGHHHFGAWWLAQLACVGGLVGLSASRLRRSPGPRVVNFVTG